MSEESRKEEVRIYLQRARDAMVWKLDGLSDYDIRRPLVPSGTNLLGLVKHLAGVEAGYFGDCFGRPFGEPMPWAGDVNVPNIDMWATADETRDHLTELYRRVCDHADRTLDALDLDAVGTVPWWPEERRRTTLHRVLVHVTAETNRHAGHADIVRELIDGAAGLHPAFDNLPAADETWWRDYRARLEQVARDAGGHPG